MKPILRTLIVCALFVTILGSQQACTKADIVNNSSDVIFALKEAAPIIKTFVPQYGPEIDLAIGIAGQLQVAVAAADWTAALHFINSLIPTFQKIVNDINIAGLSQAVKAEIMSALALADVGLHFLATHVQQVAAQLKKSAPSSATTLLVPNAAIVAFEREAVWGNNYKLHKRR